MPRYRFGLAEQNIPNDEPAQWHPDDVAAMQAAADITAELVRNCAEELLVLAFRVER